MARAIASDNDIDNCGLTYSELQELWLGTSHDGSLFGSREELRAAWEKNRDLMMRLWGRGGRRPAAYYEFEWSGVRPAYDLERSTLWRAGLLTAEEKAALEREWRAEFEKAQAADFTLNDGRGLLKGNRARRAHYAWADIPAELIEAWSAERRRRGKVIRKLEAEAGA